MNKILTLNDATKSKHGRDMYDFREVINHPLKWENVQIVPVDSTFSMSPEIADDWKRGWKEAKEKNPKFFDASKLRFEYVEWNGGRLIIGLSDEITYSKHNIIRHKGGLERLEYPTPMTINNFQETLDGFILFGVRDPEVSDQSGGAVMGAGFHDPIIGKGIIYPGGIFETSLREGAEETEYFEGETRISGPVYRDEMRMIGLIWGSNRDITAAFYMPLRATSDNIDLNRDNREYHAIYKIKNSDENLKRILDTGNLEGVETKEGPVRYNIPLADHPIGVVESFLRLRDRLPRVGYHQH